MKKNFFIALFALIFATPSWATLSIVGSQTLSCVNTYSLQGVGASALGIRWKIKPIDITQQDTFPIVLLSDTFASTLTVQRWRYGSTHFGYLNEYTPYFGQMSLKAYVINSNFSIDSAELIVTLPQDDTLPQLPWKSLTKITPLLSPRTFTISNCLDVSDNMLFWEVQGPQSSTIDSTHTGRSWTIAPTASGIMTLKVYNLELCSSLSSDFQVEVNLYLPNDPFDPLLLFPNPVTTGTAEISVTNQNYNRENYDDADNQPISYTLELWDDHLQFVRALNSSIDGAEDKVYLNVNGLRNGIYFLALKVNDEILSSKKMIINH